MVRLLEAAAIVLAGIIMFSVDRNQQSLYAFDSDVRGKVELPLAFEFSCRGEPQPGAPEFPITILEAKSRHGHKSNLSGKAVVIVAKTREDGSAVRVKIDNFYVIKPPHNGETQSVSFATVRHLDVFAEHYFIKLPRELIQEAKRYDRFKAELKKEAERREVWAYVELTYTNAAKEPITERFQMIYPAKVPKSVNREPTCDHVIDLNTKAVRKADRHLDFELIAKKVEELLADTPQRN